MIKKLMESLNIKSTKLAKLLFASILCILAVIIVFYIGMVRSTPTMLVAADGNAINAATANSADGNAINSAGDNAVNSADADSNTADSGAFSGYAPLALPDYAQPIMVYVSGHVLSPGVFEFYEGARIVDAINAAGGFSPYADQNAINLAARLIDAQHIIVFSTEDNMPPSTIAAGNAAGNTASNVGSANNQETNSPSGLININTATSDQLQSLNGIGPSRANNIIAHRQARGAFNSIEEIKNVSGIGQSIFDGLRNDITVD